MGPVPASHSPVLRSWWRACWRAPPHTRSARRHYERARERCGEPRHKGCRARRPVMRLPHREAPAGAPVASPTGGDYRRVIRRARGSSHCLPSKPLWCVSLAWSWVLARAAPPPSPWAARAGARVLAASHAAPNPALSPAPPQACRLAGAATWAYVWCLQWWCVLCQSSAMRACRGVAFAVCRQGASAHRRALPPSLAVA